MPQEQILVDASALREGLAGNGWIAVDCRFDLGDVTAGRRAYEEGHVPGAVFLDLDNDLAGPITENTGRHPLPDAGSTGATLGALGIRRTDTVVVYDAGNGAVAARAWWILRWLGMQSVYMLDGGFERWRSLDLPIDTTPLAREPTTFRAGKNGTRVVGTSELAADVPGIARRNLLDARDRSRYRGEQEPIDPVAGHIPGAVNLPFAEFVNKDGTWRSREERTALLESVLGADREVRWSVMCGSGVTACHLAISGLEAGFSEPHVYIGSWSEWIRDPARPIEGSGE